MSDCIRIEELEVRSRIGVTAKERRRPQRLLVTVEMTRSLAAAARGDDLRRTIDYDAVARRVRDWAGRGARNLIERLAVEVAEMVLREFRPRRVRVTVKKFILPRTRFVSVTVDRRRR